ncbi:MAG: hypothetical protein AAGB31_12930, partial [Bdellovibrio sp.]
MKTIQYLWLFGGITMALMASVVGFVYIQDPLCFYRCENIELGRPSQNVYYHAAQTAKAHPDAQVLILGSSRGETTSPLWVQERTGLKTLNLSQGGADLILKIILAKVSVESEASLKRIIWLGDFFELISQNTDAKVFLTQAFDRNLPEILRRQSVVHSLKKVQKLTDHNTFEAALAGFSGEMRSLESVGSGEGIDYQ